MLFLCEAVPSLARPTTLFTVLVYPEHRFWWLLAATIHSGPVEADGGEGILGFPARPKRNAAQHDVQFRPLHQAKRGYAVRCLRQQVGARHLCLDALLSCEHIRA